MSAAGTLRVLVPPALHSYTRRSPVEATGDTLAAMFADLYQRYPGLRFRVVNEQGQSLGDGGEVSMDDVLAAQMSSRASDSGITFVAFTATPKTKTMELFGTRPDPTRKPGKDNVPAPFHVYSMR